MPATMHHRHLMPPASPKMTKNAVDLSSATRRCRRSSRLTGATGEAADASTTPHRATSSITSLLTHTPSSTCVSTTCSGEDLVAVAASLTTTASVRKAKHAVRHLSPHPLVRHRLHVPPPPAMEMTPPPPPQDDKCHPRASCPRIFHLHVCCHLATTLTLFSITSICHDSHPSSPSTATTTTSRMMEDRPPSRS
ncbi:hypothetical protein F5148DRAFT_577447 [Russula earlei]|uniref:Uncharacterized protein n=1 Tax=Russula earlei TaxID=71964 RepID=A0ACC0TVG2_9AGAM|nr:hypothetical protein F5148DRAFT_577447 [Russula earlei]